MLTNLNYSVIAEVVATIYFDKGNQYALESLQNILLPIITAFFK